MIRKKIFFALGAFREDFEVCEDFEFFLRYLHFYPIGLVKLYDFKGQEQKTDKGTNDKTLRDLETAKSKISLYG